MKEINDIFILPTEKTPMIDFNHLSGELVLSGRSIPENAAKIYEPLVNWTKEYTNYARTTTNLRLDLEYFNTSSSLWITKIIKTLSGIKDRERILLIHLYFNIEDFESVEDLKDDISPITDIISTSDLSVGCLIYGTDDHGNILKESRVFI